jgi:hypothetical protein
MGKIPMRGGICGMDEEFLLGGKIRARPAGSRPRYISVIKSKLIVRHELCLDTYVIVNNWR